VPAARQVARGDRALMDGLADLEADVPEANFLHQVLGFTDGLELLVLHPHERKGFRVVLEAVNFNFHLFTLLQGVLIGDPAHGLLAGPAPDPRMLAVARGEEPHTELLSDHARFHFYNWTGWLPDRTYAATDLATWVWGEGRPRDIALFEGRAVVLLGPTVLA